jgi:hypothetical protein
MYDVSYFTVCEDVGSYRVDVKVSHGSTAGLTNLSLVHTQVEPKKISIASGSAQVVGSLFFEVAPTEVRIVT